MAPADATVVAIAARQQGMVSASQLVAAGFDSRAVARRCASGWFARRHRGVYQVGPIAGPLAAEAAALLACGKRAVLSHRTAAALMGLRTRAQGEPVEVIVLGRTSTAHRGVLPHRVRSLAVEDVGRLHGLPITSPLARCSTSPPRCPSLNSHGWSRRPSRNARPLAPLCSGRSNVGTAGPGRRDSAPSCVPTRSPRSRARRRSGVS